MNRLYRGSISVPLYFTLSITATATWWGHPIGWLLAFGLLHDILGMYLMFKRSLHDELNQVMWIDGQLLALRGAYVGIEFFTMIVIIAGAARNEVHPLWLNAAILTWGATVFVSHMALLNKLPRYNQLGEFARPYLLYAGTLGALGGIFVLWRGDPLSGIGILIFGGGDLLLHRYYDNKVTRRLLATAQIGLLAFVGLVHQISGLF